MTKDNHQQQTQPSSANPIIVERNGIRLTWNVMVVVASMAAGFYVNSYITPIKELLESLKATSSAHTADITALKSELQKTVSDIETHKQVDNMLSNTATQQLAEAKELVHKHEALIRDIERQLSIPNNRSKR